MNILLDAYYDHNFGDDLFISILTCRYSHHRFYAFIANRPVTVQRWADRIPNLTILPECPAIQQSGLFDMYIMIGGDMIPDFQDYERRISFMQAVKKTGGYVAMVGFNLYEYYSQATYESICRMIHLADDVVTRDLYSYDYIRAISDTGKVRLGADMAFIITYGKEEPQKASPILGISVREKWARSKEEQEAYQKSIAKVADAYLLDNPEAHVHFLALSYGSADDVQESQAIIQRMKCQVRIKVVAYSGHVWAFIKEFEKCSSIIATRFHSMILALFLHKPFVPVPYAVKINHILDQIEYTGYQIPYGDENIDIAQVLTDLGTINYDFEKLNEYEQRAQTLFSGIDSWIEGFNRTSVFLPPQVLVNCPMNNGIPLLRNLDAEIEDALHSRIYRLAYLIHRFKLQGLSCRKSERQLFRHWIYKKIRHQTSSDEIESVYNPLRRIQAIIRDSLS